MCSLWNFIVQSLDVALLKKQEKIRNFEEKMEFEVEKQVI